jgi:alpha-1,3-glucosyltransferase
MAITYHLPLSQWYFDTTSMWTLDYPPLFAWFEFCLAHLASLVDSRILALVPEPVVLSSVRYFQRASVMVSDLALLAAAWSFVHTIPNDEAAPTTATRHAALSTRAVSVRPSLLPAHAQPSSTAAAASAAAHSSWRVELQHWAVLLPLVFSAGLFIVDHVHFQYNGMLLALLIYACSLVRQGRNLAAGVAFAVLLNAKHLFLYLAPAFTVYLWRHYCSDVRYIAAAPSGSASSGTSRRAQTLGETCSSEPAPRIDDYDDHLWHAGSFRPLRLVALGACVAGVFALSLGPLLAVGGLPQLAQLKERLFPFGRGLLHAYWAPNVWALYAAADRALVFGE